MPVVRVLLLENYLKTTEFKSGIPDTLTVGQKLELMKEVRIGMGLK